MDCISCGKISDPVRILEVKGFGVDRTYQIEFCACGLGKTIFETGENLETLNDKYYNDIESRIKKYYYYHSHHIQIRYNQSLRFIRNFSKGNKLLEVGSNLGYTLNLAQKQGFDAYGCEINDRSAKFCELVYNIPVSKNLFDVEDKFDVVIMNDVLEHFPDPRIAVEKVSGILNTGGVFFIQLPNNRAGLSYHVPFNWMYWLPPDHTYHFDISSLQSLLETRGFVMKWARTASGIEDFKIMRFIPESIKQRILYFMFHNQFYWPGLYEKRKEQGALVQAIFVKI